MIEKANEKMLNEIKHVWKVCFPKQDPRYMDFYFKNIYDPDSCYVNIEDGMVVSVLMRNRHALMFNDRVISVSMICGVATLPEYRRKGCMKELMDVVIDACEHSELLTLIQTENPSIYEPYGFRMIYNRTDFTLQRKDVRRITNFGCAYEPSAIDLLKVYSAFIKRFNGFYARDLEYFVRYKKEVTAVGGKFVAYYDGKNQIRGYAAMIPQGSELRVEEIVYLDSMSLFKLCNAALQERRVIHLLVSEAEDLSRLFPDAMKNTYGSTMVRLNDPELFMRLFNRRINTIEEAMAISIRPLNLNEFV